MPPDPGELNCFRAVCRPVIPDYAALGTSPLSATLIAQFRTRMERTAKMFRKLLLAAPLLALPTSAFAVSDAVKKACSADYASLCSQYKVGTEALRTCMRSHRHTLTDGCIKALGHSSEVTQEDIRQYKRETGK